MPRLRVSRKNIKNGETSVQETVAYVEYPGDKRGHTYFICFYEQERSGDIEAIREAAQQGKAWGRGVFLERLASKLGRVVAPRKKGRPKKEEK